MTPFYEDYERKGKIRMKKLAIIILNWNGTRDTIECLESLEKSDVYDIFVMDNGSSEEEKKELLNYVKNGKYTNDYVAGKDIESVLEEKGALKVITYKTNLGFAGGNNYIAEKVKRYYEYILLLNNDTEVPAKSIESMLQCMNENQYAAITCDIRYFYDKNLLWNAGGKFTFYGERKYYSQKKIDKLKNRGIKHIQVDFITGCAMLVSSAYLKKYGLFTNRFFHGEEDFNFCLKAKRRHARIGVDLEAIIYHKVGRTLRHNSDDKQRVFNSKVLHYSNRAIDYKEFYCKSKWLIWKEIYLFLVFVKRIISDRNVKETYCLIKEIRKNIKVNDKITKSVFDEIMQFEFSEEKNNVKE